MLTFIEEKNIFGKTANVVFTNVLSYDLNNDDCRLRYEIRFRDPNRESVAIPDDVLINGEWKVPTNILNSWSGSNQYLAYKMCEHLGLTALSGSLG